MIFAKYDELADACRRHGVARIEIFGSAMRIADFDPARSDVDFLVDFAPRTTRDPYLKFEAELEAILGRRVDLLDRKALVASRNHIRRHSILSHTETIYVA